MKKLILNYSMLIVALSFLCQCQLSDSKSVESKQDETVLTAEIITEEKVPVAETLTESCESLKEEYARLIETIVANKSDSKLITELVNWTKKPKHLRCLENDLAYNQLVEELNEQL